MDILIQVLIYIPVLMFNGWLSIKLYKARQRRGPGKFIRAIQLQHPDSVVTFMAVDDCPEDAVEQMKEAIREPRGSE